MGKSEQESSCFIRAKFPLFQHATGISASTGCDSLGFCPRIAIKKPDINGISREIIASINFAETVEGGIAEEAKLVQF